MPDLAAGRFRPPEVWNVSLMNLDLPLLSAGRHRFTRRRACFMEMVSFLAGERWSDRPPCTDPVITALARAVNDRTSDSARPFLAPLVPLAIGTRDPDPLHPVRLALFTMRYVQARVGSSAPLDCSMLLAEQHLGTARPEVLSLRYPARAFAAARIAPGLPAYASRGCPESVTIAARLLAQRTVPAERDGALRALLHSVLLYAAHLRTPGGFPEERWDEVCARLGTVPAPV